METTAFLEELKQLPLKQEILDALVADIKEKGLQDEGVQDQLLSAFDDLAKLLILIDQTESMRQDLYARVDQRMQQAETQMQQDLEGVEQELKSRLESQDENAARNAIDAA